MGLTFQLDRKLDYRSIGPLLEQLRPATGQDIVLDASATEVIGAPALQILLAAARTCRRNGFAITLTNVRDDLVAQLNLMGLSVADIQAGGASAEKEWV